MNDTASFNLGDGGPGPIPLYVESPYHPQWWPRSYDVTKMSCWAIQRWETEQDQFGWYPKHHIKSLDRRSIAYVMAHTFYNERDVRELSWWQFRTVHMAINRHLGRE